VHESVWQLFLSSILNFLISLNILCMIIQSCDYIESHQCYFYRCAIKHVCTSSNPFYINTVNFRLVSFFDINYNILFFYFSFSLSFILSIISSVYSLLSLRYSSRCFSYLREGPPEYRPNMCRKNFRF
jgi:hypothetical protein